MKPIYAFLFGLTLSLSCLAALHFGGLYFLAPLVVVALGVWGWPR